MQGRGNQLWQLLASTQPLDGPCVPAPGPHCSAGLRPAGKRGVAWGRRKLGTRGKEGAQDRPGSGEVTCLQGSWQGTEKGLGEGKRAP